MRLKQRLQSSALRVLLSPPAERILRGTLEARRRLARYPHVITAYLRIDDPYSLFIARRLADLAAAYAMHIELRIVADDAPDEFFPARDALTTHARRDGHVLATLLREDFTDLPLDEQSIVTGRNGVLCGDDIQAIHALCEAFWSGESQRLAGLLRGMNDADAARADRLLANNRRELHERGHYNSAMLHYAGEWYWGVDRLHHLLARLDSLGLQREGTVADSLRAILARLNPPLPSAPRPASGQILEYFHSFRSPYAYIALERTFVVADYLGLTLDIKPILPMVKRGLALPREKLIYILRDANREARRLGVPFGHITDASEAAVRCIALFIAAREIGREREWLVAAGRAIWAEGIDLGDAAARLRIARRVGLSRAQVDVAEQDGRAEELADANRKRLTEAGLWGVPSFVTGDIALWGQDRLGALVHVLS